MLIDAKLKVENRTFCGNRRRKHASVDGFLPYSFYRQPLSLASHTYVAHLVSYCLLPDALEASPLITT